MTQRIQLLDNALADQIAAGEVVERPASVVKELVENAIDAGCQSLRIEIDDGGCTRICVSDDGEGIVPEDAPLAVLRHATSKIRAASDLERIQTLGFRGEALPSIASVSRFEMRTRTRDQAAATQICVEGGSAPDVREVGGAPGTTVIVRDLFYNVPARKKFLKSQGTESAQIAAVVRRTALAYPALRLSLWRNGKRSLEWAPAPDLISRAKSVFPKETLSNIEAERDGVRVRAMLGAPERARSGAGGLYLFVNQRPVKDRSLARAIAFAYGSVLPPGRYPVGVVFLELDPSEIDVNVHPQKAEVRFARGRRVFELITRQLATGLGTAAWSGPRRPPVPQPAPSFPQSSDMPSGNNAEADPWGLTPSADANGHTTRYPDASPSHNDAHPPMPLGAWTDATPVSTNTRAETTLFGEIGFFASLRVVGQMRKMFIVCEGSDGLYILDQHAADERIRFNQLRQAHESRAMQTQRLLIPERIETTAGDVNFVEENREALESLGIDVVAIGEQTLAVHAIPALVKGAPPARIIQDVIDQLRGRGERTFGDMIDTVLATMACHGSIRGGDALSPEECRALLRNLDRVSDFGTHCPHGRPVIFRMPFQELEKKLGR